MKTVRTFFAIVFTSLLLLPQIVSAQAFVDCKMDLIHHVGATASARGLLETVNGSPTGFLDVSLAGTNVKSISLTSVDFLHTFPGTALFEGPGLILVQENDNRRPQKIRGTFFGYLEDFSPSAPDQVIFEFRASSGETVFFSSARVTRGDILVIPE